jgi:hypothetical protein
MVGVNYGQKRAYTLFTDAGGIFPDLYSTNFTYTRRKNVHLKLPQKPQAYHDVKTACDDDNTAAVVGGAAAAAAAAALASFSSAFLKCCVNENGHFRLMTCGKRSK